MSGRIRPRRLCTCTCPTSFFRSLSLSSHLLALAIFLLSSHLIPYGGVPRMCVQAKAHHGGVGYQTRSRLPSAGFSFFLSSPPFVFLPSPPYLFPFFITVPSFSFSFPPHLLEFSPPLPLLCSFLSLFLSSQPWQPSWGMCSVIERTIQNNNKLSSPLPLTFHLVPPSSPVLQST